MRNAYKKLIINQRRNNKIINELKVDNIEDKIRVLNTTNQEIDSKKIEEVSEKLKEIEEKLNPSKIISASQSLQ